MYALFATIILVLDIIWWLVILAAVFSWLYAFNVINPRNQIVDTIGTMLFKITEPMLAPIRRFMPNLGGIDISPIVLLVIIFFIREFIRTSVMPAVI